MKYAIYEGNLDRLEKKLTYFGLMKKVNNETEFKASEIKALKDLLNLTDDDATKIFFA